MVTQQCGNKVMQTSSSISLFEVDASLDISKLV
jgi:hypothetical protein